MKVVKYHKLTKEIIINLDDSLFNSDEEKIKKTITIINIICPYSINFNATIISDYQSKFFMKELYENNINFDIVDTKISNFFSFKNKTNILNLILKGSQLLNLFKLLIKYDTTCDLVGFFDGNLIYKISLNDHDGTYIRLTKKISKEDLKSLRKIIWSNIKSE